MLRLVLLLLQNTHKSIQCTINTRLGLNYNNCLYKILVNYVNFYEKLCFNECIDYIDVQFIVFDNSCTLLVNIKLYKYLFFFFVI